MSNTDNPYAAPESFLAEADESYSGPLRVEGDLVCVGDKVHLSEICVISGATTDLVKLKKKPTYAGPVVLIAFLLSPLIGLILYAIMKKQTTVTIYLNREVRSKRRWKVFYGFVFLFAAIGLFIALISSGAVDTAPTLLFLPLVLFIVAIVLMVKGGQLLTVKKFDKPDNFWLKGFKEPFFATLTQDPHGIAQSGF
jgi:uncharacterized protein YacL